MISKKTINAIHVCVFLAGQRSQGYVTTAALSPRLGLSVSYLESILKTLRYQQIVTAMKGPGGGYMIPGDLSQISIWDIVSVFEPTCEDARQSSTVDFADYELELEQVVKDTLSHATLSDFAGGASVALGAYVQPPGRFKFKPLPAPFIPQAPNSVFQLHMSL